ncbi:hypothetical protein ACIOUG_01920 [Pseudomonas sp. NPDC087803]|uniref:glycine-rich domain-containing protein n=1 Tax=Pseudomonas sp. NPDC087803 TaxID=3364448 RepID=UPI0038299B61
MFNLDKKLIELLILALGMIGATYNAQATIVTYKIPSPTYDGPEAYNLPKKGDAIAQTFTVPNGATKITITATGGGGGGGGGGGALSSIVNSRASGGGGGGGGSTVKCTFNLDNPTDVNFIVGNGGSGGTKGELSNDGQSGKEGTEVWFLFTKYDNKNGFKYTRVSARGGSPGLGGSRGTITGAGPGGSGGAGGRGDVMPDEPSCTIMNGESGTDGGSNGPSQKAGSAGKAGSNSCGGGRGGAGGEGGTINNSSYVGTNGTSGTKGGYACITFEY